MNKIQERSDPPIRQRIRAVADELFKQGVRPSQENVRAILQTGSNTTIADELTRWWKDVGAKYQALIKLPGISEELSRQFIAIWTMAVSEAETKLSSERDALAAKLVEVDSRATELAADLQRAQANINEIDQSLLAERDRAERVLREREELEVALKRALAEHAASNAQRNKEVDELTHKLERLTEQADGERRFHAQQLDIARQAARTAQSDLDKARRDAEKALERAHDDLAACREEIRLLSIKNGQQEGTMSTLGQELRKREEEVSTLRTQASNAALTAAAATAKADELDRAKRNLEAVIERLQRNQGDAATPGSRRRQAAKASQRHK